MPLAIPVYLDTPHVTHRCFDRLCSLLLFSLGLLSNPAIASHGGLTKAHGTLQLIKESLELILPIAAMIIGLVIVVLYMAEIMRKDDMVRWLIGLMIAGSISEIVVLLWK